MWRAKLRYRAILIQTPYLALTPPSKLKLAEGGQKKGYFAGAPAKKVLSLEAPAIQDLENSESESEDEKMAAQPAPKKSKTSTFFLLLLSADY